MSISRGASADVAPTESFEFTLNGAPVRVEGVAATTTLLDWLRASGRTGSKCGCAEGDCGACTVALVDRDAAGKPAFRAINSCLALLPMIAGREVVTVEGLEEQRSEVRGQKSENGVSTGELHPVQAAMVGHYGSQCGYCTPGFVMSLFEGYYRGDAGEPAKICDQLCGNLCRCTGYRPIRDAAMDVLRARGANGHDRFAARLLSPVESPGGLSYAGGGERFFRPTSLPELLRLKREHPEAKLVAGATEIGVELNKKFKKFPALISVEGVTELTRIEKTTGEWRIGAAATLTAVEEALCSGGMTGAGPASQEYPSLAKMLAVFASRQIRNRATLGGNLVTASPIGDSAPVLLTLDASVVLASEAGERVVKLEDFFVGYRKTQLREDEVMKEIVLPRERVAQASGLQSGGRQAGTPAVVRRADFQKASHRRELDISIVAAAFCVDCDATGVVTKARVAYGGVAVTPMRARKAEAVLVGRTLSAAKEGVAEILRGEFKPIDDVRGSAEYRRGVVVTMWEKFVAGETSAAMDGAAGFRSSAGVPPAGSTDAGGDACGTGEASRALRHESAVGHVTGRARYVDDIASRRPMLEVWPVMAPHARARILRRDATKARALPGVCAVLMAEDVPGQNNVGVSRHDETLFAKDEVCYHGHIVAVVIGESLAACRAAAALVEVAYEPLPPIVSIESAIAAGSFHTEPRALKRGDCATALVRAPRRIEGKFEFGGQEHFYLETQAAWAEATDDGGVHVMSSTQHPSEIQAIVAEVLRLPRNQVVVESPRMGGGFGGKETQGNTPAALVALAALKTGRPVRVQFDRDLDMVLTGKRHPFWSRFEVGFDDDGRLLAAKVELVSDGGWSLDLSQPVLDRGLFHLDNAYYLPAVEFTGRVAKTNVTSHTAFRGFGGPQGMLVIEEIIDRIARTLGLPPEVVRERNLYRGAGATNTTHYGEDIGDYGARLAKMWAAALGRSRFAERRKEIASWNAVHERVKRGIAITPVKFGISFTLTHYNQAGALVHIFQDGTVQVNHGGTEMGQGVHTKVLGVAMRELGLPASAIRMMRTSTDKVPNTSATAASSGADLNGAAVRAACVTLRERLAPVAAGMLGGGAGSTGLITTADGGVGRPRPTAAADEIAFEDGFIFRKGHAGTAVAFADVCKRAYEERVSLSATGYYRTPGIYWDWAKAEGRPFAYFAGGVAVSEVEVDGYTGMSRVRRVDIVHDVGDSLNPGVDRGQIEGGFVQGMGWLTSEELKWGADGRLLTHSASTYQIPAISDAPMEFNVTLLPDAANANAIHGSKAVGEPPLMLAISVREAIRDAVAACGEAGGDAPLASPATGEAVFLAVQRRLGCRAEARSG
ncbi:MAG TPA: xanthine dehydrogenase molybdopterin binding subunit [Opitutus sp.]|nr:xanthine dehydrogenase molybdopterin binding subunit [Opitutus sp.]